jgi:hypothetical protein
MYSAQDWQGQYAPCPSRRRFVLGTDILTSYVEAPIRVAQMRSWIMALQHHRLLAQAKV